MVEWERWYVRSSPSALTFLDTWFSSRELAKLSAWSQRALRFDLWCHNLLYAVSSLHVFRCCSINWAITLFCSGPGRRLSSSPNADDIMILLQFLHRVIAREVLLSGSGHQITSGVLMMTETVFKTWVWAFLELLRWNVLCADPSPEIEDTDWLSLFCWEAGPTDSSPLVLSTRQRSWIRENTDVPLPTLGKSLRKRFAFSRSRFFWFPRNPISTF